MTAPVRAFVFDVGNTLWFEASAPARPLEGLQADMLQPLLDEWGARLERDDLEQLLADIWEAYLEAWHVETARGRHKDPSLPFIIRGATATRGIDLAPEQAEAWWRAAWIPVRHFGYQLYPDAVDVLRDLKAMGMKVGLNTNRPCTAEMFRADLEDFPFLQYVDAIMTSGETGYVKPHPSTFEAVLDLLGTAPQETVMVGDTCAADCAGARAVGMRAILKLNGRYDAKPCEAVPAPRVYSTPAIVLRQRKLGDVDKIVTLYTANYGKVEGVAKGVRRSRSKLAGHVEPLTHATFQLARGKTLDIVTQVVTIEPFQALRDDLDRMSRALYACELLDKFTETREEHFDLYRLLLDTLRRIAERDEYETPVRYYEMALLDAMGYRPELEGCVRCRNKLSAGTNYWSAASGGVVCPSCRSDETAVRPISANAVKLLRLLLHGSFADVSRVNIDAHLGAELERALLEYVRWVLERDVRSAAFIDALRRKRVSRGAAQRSSQPSPAGESQPSPAVESSELADHSRPRL
jgi:DNA repair protein RecO (recombination protein O)